MYIGGTDERALHHLFAGVIDNSMDEAVAGHASFIEVELEEGGALVVTDNGRGIPVDPHPKFPGKSALEVIMTTLHAGGKFDSKVYETSGGLHGVGISVVNALSDVLEVEVARNQTLYRQCFSRGHAQGALEIVGDQVKRIAAKPSGTLGLTFFSSLLVSIWSANAAMKAMFDALNVVYEEDEKRNFFMLNLRSLTFTVGALIFIIIALNAIVVVPVVFNFLGLGSEAWLIAALRWPGLLIVILGALSVLYRFGPSREYARWRWVGVGSLVAGLLWLVASLLFSWYVSNFGTYNETYGSLGAVIGFMTWIWISSTIVLVGGEINAEIEHQTGRDTTTGQPQPLGTRRARMADTLGAAA